MLSSKTSPHDTSCHDKSGPVLLVAAGITATVYLSLAAWVLLAGA